MVEVIDLTKILEIRRDNLNKKPACKTCPYYDCKFVPSYISSNNVVIVGEAPGRVEAEQSTPFVGDSGQLLREVLRDVGFDDKQITYMNSVKCRPPNNETPDKKTASLCSKMFLMNELQEVKPKLVILAGAVALQLFFPKEKITAKAGTFIKMHDVTFMPCIHPAYFIRNPLQKSRLRKDLKRAYQFASGELTSKKKYVLLTDASKLTKATEFLLQQELLSFDIETSGTVDTFDKKMEIWTVAFAYDKDRAFCIPLNHPENADIQFRELCWKSLSAIMSSNVKKIAQNASFDMQVLKHFGVETNGFWADTMVMAFLLDENRYSIGLKQLTQEYLDGYTGEWSKDLFPLSLYNCEDVDNCLQLYHLFAPKIHAHPNMYSLFRNVLTPMIEVITDMELAGVQIDVEAAKQLSVKLENKLQSIYEHISESIPQSKGMNLSSTKQLRELMFDVLKYPTLKKTPSGQESTDNEVLEKLARRGYKLAKAMVQVRQIEKLLSTYVTKIPELVNDDGRLRGRFNICGARTGRLSSSNPNLQNIPRDKSVKRLFTAGSGRILLNADASQAELRVGCSIANERNMIKAYQEGQDIHKLTASRVLKKKLEEVTKDDRQKAKAVNFGFLYGQSAEGFQRTAENDYDLKLSIEECSNFRESFYKAYPGFQEWYNRTNVSLSKYGYVEYPTGRFRRFPEVKGVPVRDIPGDIFRKGVNSPVQGSSSDIVVFVMVCVRSFIQENKLPAQLILTVHDSIVLECSEECEMSIMREVDRICKVNIPEQFPWLRVPMKFDFGIGKNWGDIKEL